MTFECFLAILLKFCSADHPSSLRKILTAKPQKSSQNPSQFDLKFYKIKIRKSLRNAKF
ncbi:hypothetical protein CAMGR0001_2027 [Campylobacter gracilis RM3268]|uniref:Uncharacterized protein n=1 Tax=Campylobacter gracilis RM3268 TaxID=553220 RepID=C8PLL7_9BACT|nr:hypothetical protein CAMGR0001_2027 [Campylobacter gracilis RM3268]